MNVSRHIAYGFILFFGLVTSSAGQPNMPPSRDITQTPHNLSVSGGGGAHDVKSTKESRICIFCHAPHHATSVTPLWSRDISPLTIYVPYKSSTIKANPQQPMGASRLCLSCHDGTIALGLLAGNYVLDPGLKAFKDMPSESDPAKNPNLGTDLSDDHPISFIYSYGTNMELNSPETLEARGIKLAQGEYVECTSCHDPHNNQYGKFLVRDVSIQHDALCTECHNKKGWNDTDTAHRTGGARFPAVSAKVATDGCASCHIPHSAQKGEHLLKLTQVGAGEETNCYSSCHRDVPYTNVWSQFNTSIYTHPVQNYTDLHTADEALPLNAGKKHVECVDCHNPHQTGWQGAPLGAYSPQVPPLSKAPDVNGPLRGVRGVDVTGMAVVDVAQYEYEICYRCHAGARADQFTSLSAQLPTRVFTDFDESSRFNPANPSFHPVAADRQGTGRSLLSQFQTKMFRIYCNDCHNSHGSNEPHMLRGQNMDTFPSSSTSYPLCFRCHDPDFLLNPLAAPHAATASLHQKHVLGPHDNGDARKASCSVCHDPHGTPLSRGATQTNADHLLNFDKRYAGLTPEYDATARSCMVSGICHVGTSPYPGY